MIYNVDGKPLNSEIPELIDPSFGYMDEQGRLIIFWDEESDFVDAYGFDKTNVEDNGDYAIDVELPVGTILIRYGRPEGSMTAPFGTPYEMLSLPYKKDTIQYHQYKVVADGVNVKCVVRQGKARGMFVSPGGAIQYKHQQSIYKEIAEGKLEEDYSWMNKKTENV